MAARQIVNLEVTGSSPVSGAMEKDVRKVGHDLNNMLTTIFGYLEVIKESTRDKEIIIYVKEALKLRERVIDLIKSLR